MCVYGSVYDSMQECECVLYLIVFAGIWLSVRLYLHMETFAKASPCEKLFYCGDFHVLFSGLDAFQGFWYIFSAWWIE